MIDFVSFKHLEGLERSSEGLERTGNLPFVTGGVFHSKGAWGCAAHKGILFQTSSLAKDILFGNFSRVWSW